MMAGTGGLVWGRRQVNRTRGGRDEITVNMYKTSSDCFKLSISM